MNMNMNVIILLISDVFFKNIFNLVLIKASFTLSINTFGCKYLGNN